MDRAQPCEGWNAGSTPTGDTNKVRRTFTYRKEVMKMSGKKQRKLLQQRLGQHCGQMSKAKRDEAAQRLANVEPKTEKAVPVTPKPEKR